MIHLLIGDDYSTAAAIQQLTLKIAPNWKQINYHKFKATELKNAITNARSSGLGPERTKVVVIENCHFDAEQLSTILTTIAQIPSTTELVLSGPSLDKRSKNAKALLKLAAYQKYPGIPAWKARSIKNELENLARQSNLILTPQIVEYLATAIGGDRWRLKSEVQKLATFALDRPLDIKNVRALIPNVTDSCLTLSKVILQGKSRKCTILINKLLTVNTYPLVIIATLVFQFRLWLWLKSGLEAGITDPLKLAQLCKIGNPNRIYYLRQEVEQTSILSLKQATIQLCQLETDGKIGKIDQNSLLPQLLKLNLIFKDES